MVHVHTQYTLYMHVHTLCVQTLQRNTPKTEWCPADTLLLKSNGRMNVNSITSDWSPICTHTHTHTVSVWWHIHTVTHPCSPTPDTNKNCVHFVTSSVSLSRGMKINRRNRVLSGFKTQTIDFTPLPKIRSLVSVRRETSHKSIL